MKALEMNQMEMIEGGSCGNAVGGLVVAGGGLLLAELAIAATFGPVGLGLLGITYAFAWGAAAYASATVAVSC